jgi:hypothetical protein
VSLVDDPNTPDVDESDPFAQSVLSTLSESNLGDPDDPTDDCIKSDYTGGLQVNVQ